MMASFSSTGVPLDIEIVTHPSGLEEVEPGQSQSLSVQATGTGPRRYQWCKEKEDDPTSQESAQQQVFREHTGEFKQLVDASNLYQPLFQDRLITSAQVSDLTQEVPGNTNPRKVDNLLKWLPTSSNFLKKLIVCLRKTDHLGHLELADSYEKALWPPLSPQNLLYDGVNNSTLQLCSVKKHHEGVYRCRVSNSAGSVLSEPASVSLIGSDEVAVRVFVTRLQEHPEKRAETAQSFISKLQPGSVVGYTALSAAIIKCGDCKEVVRAFLAKGWTSDKPIEDGRTLVHMLADRGCSEALRLALQDGGENSARVTDKNRCTPLHLAVKAGHVRAVRILLDAESLSSRRSVDYQDKDFNTALHLAVGSDNLDMVQALLERSVNLGILNGDHKTAQEVARERGHGGIIHMLEDKDGSSSMRPCANGRASSLLGARGLRANSLDSSMEQRRETGESHAGTSGYGSVGDAASLQRYGSVQSVRTADRPMMELQKQLSDYRGTLTGKKLLRSGVLRKCTRKGMLEDRMIYLLTDVMLHTKHNPLTGKYSVRDEMSVRGMKVQDPDPPAVKNEPLSFTVTSKQRGLSLVARTLEEKKEWIQILESTIDDLAARQQPATLPEAAGVGARAPVWVPDNHVTACQICNKRFTFIGRKHHCRQCGKVICGACSPHKRYLTYLKNEGRVCKECKEGSSGLYSPGCESTTEGEQRDPLERSAGTIMSGYATKLQGGGGGRGEQRWYRLSEDDVLYIFGAHEDTMELSRIPLKMGYTLHGDRGSSKIVLSHASGREELNETFVVPVESYLRWHEVLKERT